MRRLVAAASLAAVGQCEEGAAGERRQQSGRYANCCRGARIIVGAAESGLANSSLVAAVCHKSDANSGPRANQCAPRLLAATFAADNKFARNLFAPLPLTLGLVSATRACAPARNVFGQNVYFLRLSCEKSLQRARASGKMFDIIMRARPGSVRVSTTLLPITRSHVAAQSISSLKVERNAQTLRRTSKTRCEFSRKQNPNGPNKARNRRTPYRDSILRCSFQQALSFISCNPPVLSSSYEI